MSTRSLRFETETHLCLEEDEEKDRQDQHGEESSTACSDKSKLLCQSLKEGCKSVYRRTFNMKSVRNRMPILKWMPTYTWEMLSKDLIAGVTVGLTAIPQGMAYGSLAGLPLQVKKGILNPGYKTMALYPI